MNVGISLWFVINIFMIKTGFISSLNVSCVFYVVSVDGCPYDSPYRPCKNEILDQGGFIKVFRTTTT